MIRRIPLFPLPGVVLLPGTLLPLHIFEPRYREMVAAALSGERTIGMALLREGEDPMTAAPPVLSIGGAGEIVDHERLDDGRYNIMLRGRFRYRILSEEPPAPYRIGRVEELPPLPFTRPEEEERSRRIARQLFESLRADLDLAPLPQTPIETESLASELAVRLRYGPTELQALLETDSLRSRFATIIGRLRDWRQRLDLLAPYRPAELDVRWN